MFLFASNLDAKVSVEIVKLNWVKLTPAPEVTYGPKTNGLQEVIVAHGCGMATASYTRNDLKELLAEMDLGKFCNNPFQAGKDQVIVLVDDNKLEEYYRIQEDGSGNKFIVVDKHSVIAHFIKKLPKPIYFGKFSQENISRIVGDLESGPFKVIGEEIYLTEAVFISDIEKQNDLQQD